MNLVTLNVEIEGLRYLADGGYGGAPVEVTVQRAAGGWDVVIPPREQGISGVNGVVRRYISREDAEHAAEIFAMATATLRREIDAARMAYMNASAQTPTPESQRPVTE